MNVSILQNDYRIQNVGILLGGCLTVKKLWDNPVYEKRALFAVDLQLKGGIWALFAIVCN